ncbi:MAG: hypothetical protein ACTSR2_01190 [Candidatus Hodarchaeales archaeon]
MSDMSWAGKKYLSIVKMLYAGTIDRTKAKQELAKLYKILMNTKQYNYLLPASPQSRSRLRKRIRRLLTQL